MKPTIIGKPMSEEQVAIVDLLKEALAQALEGNIKTVGVVACLDGGFATVMAGRQAADLNLGCDELKRKILDAVMEGTEERQTRRSAIFKPLQ